MNPVYSKCSRSRRSAACTR